MLATCTKVLVLCIVVSICLWCLILTSEKGENNYNEDAVFKSVRKPDSLSITLAPARQSINAQQPIYVRIDYNNETDDAISLDAHNTLFPHIILTTPSGNKMLLVPPGPESDIEYPRPYPFLTKNDSIGCTVDLRNFVIEEEIPETQRSRYEFSEKGEYQLYVLYYLWQNAEPLYLLTREQILKMPPSSNIVTISSPP